MLNRILTLLMYIICLLLEAPQVHTHPLRLNNPPQVHTQLPFAP